MPYTAPDSLINSYPLFEQPPKTVIFSSCGKYSKNSPCLPKYGLNAPRQMARKGPRIIPGFAHIFTPSRPQKPRWNANMGIFFSGGGMFMRKW